MTTRVVGTTPTTKMMVATLLTPVVAAGHPARTTVAESHLTRTTVAASQTTHPAPVLQLAPGQTSAVPVKDRLLLEQINQLVLTEYCKLINRLKLTCLI